MSQLLPGHRSGSIDIDLMELVLEIQDQPNRARSQIVEGSCGILPFNNDLDMHQKARFFESFVQSFEPFPVIRKLLSEAALVLRALRNQVESVVIRE